MADDCAPEVSPAITRCGLAHVAVLSHLHGLCFDEGWDAAAVTQLLAMPGAQAFVVTPPDDPEREPVGLVLMRVAVDEAEIITIGVRPEARGHGFAHQLFDAVCAHARANGAQRLFLEVAQDNTAAQRFYSHAGCDEVGRRRDYYKRGGGVKVDALVLQHILASN